MPTIKNYKTERGSRDRHYWSRALLALSGAVLALVLAASYFTPQPPTPQPVAPINPVERLQAVTVHVDTVGGGGSGVVVTRTDSRGQKRTFVWTAYHVIKGNLNSMGVARDWVFQGALIGRANFKAKLVAFDVDLDLALLEVRCPAFLPNTVFSKSLRPQLGDSLTHVGNFKGHSFSLSVSRGIVSRRDIPLSTNPGGAVHYVQTDAIVWPGSSGGGIFNEAGECVGIVARTGGPGIGFFIPIYYLWSFALDNDILWAFEGHSCPARISYIDEVIEVVE